MMNMYENVGCRRGSEVRSILNNRLTSPKPNKHVLFVGGSQHVIHKNMDVFKIVQTSSGCFGHAATNMLHI